MQLKKILLFIFVLGIITACNEEKIEYAQIENIDSLPRVIAQDIEILYSDSARIKMKTLAPEIQDYEDPKNPYSEFPKGVKSFFYDKEGKQESSLKAKYAKYYSNKKLWEVKYDVQLINSEGDTLLTEQLFSNEEDQQIYTDKYVRINFAAGYFIDGKGGFVSDLNFKNYEFKSVSGRFLGEGEK